MKQDYVQFLSAMETLVTLHRELLAVEQEKIIMIIDQNWKGLERQVEKSRDILKKIESAESSRIELIEKLGVQRESSLSEVSETLPAPIEADLQRHGKKLRSLLLELKDLVKRCEQLLESSLEVIDFTLSVFSGADANGKTYSDEGEEKKGDGGRTSLVFDLKA